VIIMPELKPVSLRSLRTIRVTGLVIFLFFIAIVARTPAEIDDPKIMVWQLGLEGIFLVFFLMNVLLPTLPMGLRHISALLQAALVLVILSLDPEEDFANALFVVMVYQTSLVFSGSIRWIWTFFMVFLTAGSLVYFNGFFEGLSLSLLNMAGGMIIFSYFVVIEEIERSRLKGEMMLAELQSTNEKLKLYAAQVEGLAAVEERNRLAREMHDSVSQTMFSITLNTRAAQILLKRDPAQIRPRLEELQALSHNALTQMRTLIADLRPKTE
jgi:signal transduction histidine kinase